LVALFTHYINIYINRKYVQNDYVDHKDDDDHNDDNDDNKDDRA